MTHDDNFILFTFCKKMNAIRQASGGTTSWIRCLMHATARSYDQAPWITITQLYQSVEFARYFPCGYTSRVARLVIVACPFTSSTNSPYPSFAILLWSLFIRLSARQTTRILSCMIHHIIYNRRSMQHVVVFRLANARYSCRRKCCGDRFIRILLTPYQQLDKWPSNRQ